MITMISISLPDALKQFVDEQMKQGGYADASNHIRDLIRDRQREVAAEQLRSLIAKGLASGSSQTLDKRYWSAKRKKLGP